MILRWDEREGPAADIALKKTDFDVDPAEEARHAAEQGIRVSTSQPDELVAVVFVAGRPAAEDARLREAVSRAIDRNAMVNFNIAEGRRGGGRVVAAVVERDRVSVFDGRGR